jgi:hypothetical protein
MTAMPEHPRALDAPAVNAPEADARPLTVRTRLTAAIPLRRVVAALWLAVLGLLLAATALAVLRLKFGHDHVLGFAAMFDLDGEGGVPAWFSSMLMLACAAVLAVVGRARAGDPYRRHWLVLAAIFVYLSVDETIALHERLIAPLRTLAGADGMLHYTWVVVGGPVVLVVGVAYLGYLRALPASTRRRFVVAGALYVAGALGMEMLGGYLRARHGEAYHATVLKVVVTLLEETMEMAGLILFLSALLTHLRTHVGPLALRVVAR